MKVNLTKEDLEKTQSFLNMWDGAELNPNVELREKLADLCHDQWTCWMEYLFSKCVEEVRTENGKSFKTGNIIIPRWAVERWQRQMETEYENLSEDEQDSDRKEADKFLELFKASLTNKRKN